MLLHSHCFDHLLLDLFVLCLEAAVGDKPEVVPHYYVPLLQFVQHFDFLDLHSLHLIDVVVISEITISLHFVH